MTELPVNSDEDYYVDESFEEDSQSEVEEEQEIYEDDYVDDELSQKRHIELQEDSDSQSESDAEAEFMRGNVSDGKNFPEMTIKEFSLDPKKNVTPNPQPHARRQQLYSGRSNASFSQKRMVNYPNSSSEDESQVVVTKTVAEVNRLVGVIRVHDEDEALSVRTLKPGSAHKTKREHIEYEEVVEVEEIEEEDEMEEVENNVDDDAETVYEEPRDAGSEDDEKTEYEESGDEGQDQYYDDEDDPVIRMQRPPPQEDTVTVIDASDNSSDQSGPICRMRNALDNISLYSTGNETDFTVVDDCSPHRPSGIPISRRSNIPTRFRAEVKPAEPVRPTKPIEVIEPIEPIQPPVEYVESVEPVAPEPLQTIPEPDMQEIPPIPQLEDFLNDGTLQPDAAAVKYLEQKMTQMSEMIMNSFRMSGGSAKNPALEQLAMATGMMQAHASKLSTLDEFESISTTESSIPVSSRSCGDQGGRVTPSLLRNSQGNLSTMQSSKLMRPKCRCPSDTGSMEEIGELQSEMETDTFLMDECGQGDGLMRHHPHRRRPQNNNSCNTSSATPSSCSGKRGGGSGGTTATGGVRPRSSTSQVKSKNLNRKSFSFSNYQVREIERQNHILLKKMMSVKPTATIKASTSSIKCKPNAPPKQTPPVARLSSAAVNRKKSQRQIDLDNDLLKRKLEAIGSRRKQFK